MSSEDEVVAKEADAPVKKATKNRKKKKSGLAPATNDVPLQENNRLRKLGDWPAVSGSRQTATPSIPVDKCFNKGTFPVGEILEHPGNNGALRMTGEEYRARERDEVVNYDDIRRAAEAHRQTRKHIQNVVKPGMTMLEIVQEIERKSSELVSAKGLESGWAFPTGVSIDHCAAHYTPNYGEDEVVLKADNLVKVDYGIHVGGRLVDCAFTMTFDEKFDNLIHATKDATNVGLKTAGIDVRFSEVGAAIEETIRSYEIELDGKTYEIKPIENLNGHTVDVYQVHGGKSLPIVKTDSTEKMEEGEFYAIETFASTGKGRVWDDGACSHYMLDYNWLHAPNGRREPLPKTPTARPVLEAIKQHFGTLAFCRRWLDDRGCKRHLVGLKSLVNAGIVNAYPPLVDIAGCYTSQMEHTILLRPTCKEIVSRGPDF